MAMAVPLDVAVSSSATRIEIAANAASRQRHATRTIIIIISRLSSSVR